VIFDGGAVEMLANFDPFIIQSLAIGEPLMPQEPADTIRGWEQTGLLTSAPVASGQLLVRLWLGQYFHDGLGSSERLLRDPRIQVVYGPPGAAATQKRITVRVCREAPDRLAVRIPQRAGMRQAYITYTLNDQSWRTEPMTEQAGKWTWQAPPDPALQFFVQVVDESGSVAYGSKSDHEFFGARDRNCHEEPEARYSFDEGAGSTVHDSSGADKPLDLTIADPTAVRWTDRGLRIVKPTAITSAKAARDLIDAVRKSDELSIEAWVTPLADGQRRIGQIVAIAQDQKQRSVILAMRSRRNGMADRFTARIHTTATSGVGEEVSTATGSAAASLTHIVYTRDSSGMERIYVDGVDQGRRKGAGSLSDWDTHDILTLANAITGEQPWLGEYHAIALYARSLGSDEVQDLFAAGPDRDR
jgi:hypothetical protein